MSEPAAVKHQSTMNAGKLPSKSGKAAISMKRHAKVLRDNILGVSKKAIRRMARRGGVKRMSGSVYDGTREEIMKFLRIILHDAVVMCECAKLKTITHNHILAALKRHNQTLLGF